MRVLLGVSSNFMQCVNSLHSRYSHIEHHVLLERFLAFRGSPAVIVRGLEHQQEVQEKKAGIISLSEKALVAG